MLGRKYNMVKQKQIANRILIYELLTKLMGKGYLTNITLVFNKSFSSSCHLHPDKCIHSLEMKTNQ